MNEAGEKLELRYVPLEQAVLWDRNAKKHDYGAIIKSIRRHGFLDPMKFDARLNDGRGGIVEGNGRATALRDMCAQNETLPRGIVQNGKGWLVPILFGVDAESQAAAESYAIDHNNITMLGGDFDMLEISKMWEGDAYAKLLQDLQAAEMPPVSMDDGDISAFLRAMDAEKLPEGDDDEHAGELVDKAEELQTKWQVVSGDIWQIGEHFIICGDCTNFNDWQKLLKVAGVEKVNGVFTSPPYAEQRKKQYGGIPTEKYVDWWYDVQANVRAHLAEDGSFFVNIKPHCENGERVLYVFDLVLAMQRQWKWMFIDELIWKRQGIPGNYSNRFKNVFEPIFHFSLNELKFRPDNVLSDYYENYEVKKYGRSKSTSGYLTGSFRSAIDDGARPGNIIIANQGATSTQTGIYQAATFPIALPEFFIKAYSDENDIWLDPFIGSGTTICAANRNNRRGIGIEKLEKYVAVCLERISNLTGKTPQRIEANA